MRCFMLILWPNYMVFDKKINFSIIPNNKCNDCYHFEGEIQLSYIKNPQNSILYTSNYTSFLVIQEGLLLYYLNQVHVGSFCSMI